MSGEGGRHCSDGKLHCCPAALPSALTMLLQEMRQAQLESNAALAERLAALSTLADSLAQLKQAQEQSSAAFAESLAALQRKQEESSAALAAGLAQLNSKQQAKLQEQHAQQVGTRQFLLF